MEERLETLIDKLTTETTLRRSDAANLLHCCIHYGGNLDDCMYAYEYGGLVGLQRYAQLLRCYAASHRDTHMRILSKEEDK